VQDQRFQQPAANTEAFLPGLQLLDSPSPFTFHMNIIIPRRDLLLLISRCCGLDPLLHSPRLCSDSQTCVTHPYKALFTTAAAQLYAESVVSGLQALCLSWMSSQDPAEREFCAKSGLKDPQQVRGFFSRPVISTMFHTNLGPDDATVLFPASQDRPVKSLGKVCCSARHSHWHLLMGRALELAQVALTSLDISQVCTAFDGAGTALCGNLRCITSKWGWVYDGSGHSTSDANMQQWASEVC
jgi:hypothetical protein